MRQAVTVARWRLVLVASLFLGACASGGRGPSARYEQSLDSATSACRQNPAYCVAAPGEEAAIPTAASARAAQAGASLAAGLKLFDEATKARIEDILKSCVEQANAEVNERRLGGNPTPAQCAEKVGVNEQGKPVTRAMQLGTEKHEVALWCIQERLSLERPGGFSVEQRYRYDRQTRETTLVSKEEAEALKSQGRSGELRGTLVPDLVIHSGDPLRPQAVYDLKFPCPSTRFPEWGRYPESSPYYPSTQGDIYMEAWRELVFLVAPIWGII